MGNRLAFIIILGLLVLALSTPAIAAQAEDEPPEVEYAPAIRHTELHATGQDTLSPAPGDSEQTSTHAFPLGSASASSLGPELRSLDFQRNATIGSGEWNFSLWASGDGAAQVTLSLIVSGETIDQDSIGITLTSQPALLVFSGSGVPDIILSGQTLSVQWEVDSNELPFIGSTQATMRWGSEDFPANLSFSAGMYQVDAPYLEDAGTPFRGDDHPPYSRSDLTWAVQVRWALSPEHFSPGTLIIHIDDADGEIVSVPTKTAASPDGGIYWFEIEEIRDGVTLEAHVMWNDTAGISDHSPQTIYEMDPKGPSILSSGLKTVMFTLTIPVLIGIGYWLVGRFRRLVEVASEAGHGARAQGDLKRLLTATAILMFGLNNGLVLYSYHTRQLGAAENVVILHLALIAMALGISGPLWGAIADRFGHRKKLMLFATSAAFLMMLSFPWLDLNSYIIVSTIQVAMFASVRMGIAVGTEWFPEQKGEIIGLIYAFASFASAVGAMLTSKLYVWLLPSGTSWAMLGLLVITMPALALAAWMVWKFEGDDFSWPVWMLRGDKPPAQRVKLSLKEQLAVVRGLFRFKSGWVLLCLLGVTLVAVPRGAVVLTSLRYLEVIGFDVDFTGLLEAWAVIAVLVLYAIIGRVCDDRGPQTVLFWSAVAYGTLWSIFSIGLPPMVAVMIFVVPIYPMLLVSNDALMGLFTTTEERNRGIGMAGFVAFIGQSIGIIAGFLALGVLLEKGMANAAAYEWFYRANVPLWIIAIAFTWWLAKKIEADRETVAVD